MRATPGIRETALDEMVLGDSPFVPDPRTNVLSLFGEGPRVVGAASPSVRPPALSEALWFAGDRQQWERGSATVHEAHAARAMDTAAHCEEDDRKTRHRIAEPARTLERPHGLPLTTVTSSGAAGLQSYSSTPQCDSDLHTVDRRWTMKSEHRESSEFDEPRERKFRPSEREESTVSFFFASAIFFFLIFFNFFYRLPEKRTGAIPIAEIHPAIM